MDAPHHRYGRKAIGVLRELSPALVRRLVAAGLLKPTRGRRNELHFSFEELSILRTAAALLRAKVPLRRIMIALARLREQHPAPLPLTGLSISAVGAEVVVREGRAQWTAEGGQLLLDFDGWEPGEVHPIAHDRSQRSAEEWFQTGSELEPDDPAAAEHAYRQALALDACGAKPYLNLGALLCDAGRWSEAAELYATAISRCPSDPSLHFSLGVALESLGLPAKALRSYERCLDCEPGFADAHFNVARLLEVMGDRQGVIRHLSAYRRALRTE